MKKVTFMSSIRMIIYCCICVFVNVFIAKSLALSPFYYLFVIPGCAFNTVYIINSIAYSLNIGTENTLENRESLSRYINFENLTRLINEKKISIIINLVGFALFAILYGVIL